MENNKPVKEFREGTVNAALFEREVKMPKGNFISRSVKLQLGFKNKKDKWENRSLTIVKKDLQKVLNVLTKAVEVA
jgi:hypothetical protein